MARTPKQASSLGSQHDHLIRVLELQHEDRHAWHEEAMARYDAAIAKDKGQKVVQFYLMARVILEASILAVLIYALILR